MSIIAVSVSTSLILLGGFTEGRRREGGGGGHLDVFGEVVQAGVELEDEDEALPAAGAKARY